VKRTKIMLAVPAQNGTVHVGLLDMLVKMRGGFFQYGDTVYEVLCSFLAHGTPIEAVRNALVKDFLDSDAEWMWFIDADVYPAETGIAMLDGMATADLVTGRVSVWMPKPDKSGIWHVEPTAAVEVKHSLKRLLQDGGAGAIEYGIEGTGTGCLLIRRKVLEDPRMQMPRKYLGPDGELLELEDDDPPPIFRTLYKPNGKRLFGEDYDFSSRAKALGYRIAYAPYAHWHHSKGISLLEVEKYGHSCYGDGFRKAQELAVQPADKLAVFPLPVRTDKEKSA